MGLAPFEGHRYATVIADADIHQGLWLAEGRGREAIRTFFEKLGQQGQHIEAVAMDMNTAFDLEVQEHCPNARLVRLSSAWLHCFQVVIMRFDLPIACSLPNVEGSDQR